MCHFFITGYVVVSMVVLSSANGNCPYTTILTIDNSTNYKEQNWGLKDSEKFKGGIYCSSHLAILCGGELLYSCFQLSPPNNFVKLELPFLRRLKSCTHRGCSKANHTKRWMFADCAKSEGYSNSPPHVTINMAVPALKQGSKKESPWNQYLGLFFGENSL